MEAPNKILEKVRALLSKTTENGATEKEVEAALEMAEKLMVKYNIDKGELIASVNDIDQTLIENKFKHGEAKFWIWDLLCIIGKGYNCTVLRKGYTNNYFWKIVGFDEDRKMVLELYEIILPMVRNLVSKRYKETIGTTSKGIFTRSYIEGFLTGLSIRLEKNREVYLTLEDKSKYELIVIKKDDLIKDWIDRDNNGKKLKKASASPRERKVDEDALLQGYQDGKEENYTQQLH